eukprot:74627-Chlamydomonas_euryale.AAC.8
MRDQLDQLPTGLPGAMLWGGQTRSEANKIMSRSLLFLFARYRKAVGRSATHAAYFSATKLWLDHGIKP